MITAKEQSEIQKYGCTKAERDRIQRQHPADKYWHTPYGTFVKHRQNAIGRGIEWNLTFADWWEIWSMSNKWEMRGRRVGGYCMSRLFDSGPYEIGNVHIIPTEEKINQWFYGLDDKPLVSMGRGSALTEADKKWLEELEKSLP